MSRKVKLFSYQQPVYNQLTQLSDGSSTVCLAATTGFGKTEVAAKFIQDRPDKTFLILTHGQLTLRTNFYERLAPYFPASEVCEVRTTGDAASKRVKRITIALPQGVYKHLDNLPQYDYIIVDEAHQYYGDNPDEKVMYPRILEWHQGKVILLTASHYELSVSKVFFSREAAIQSERVDDVSCRLVEVETQLTEDMFNVKGDLSEKRVDKEIDKHTFAAAAHYLQDRLPGIVACHRQEVADRMGRYLKRKGFKVVVSHTESDRDSDGIEAFKRGEYDVCVVVGRASLGFDYPKVRTFIDATYSRNIPAIEQRLGRVARRHPDQAEKLYVKLVPQECMPQYEIIMTGVMALGDDEMYRTWDGRYQSLKIRTRKTDAAAAGREGKGGTPASRPVKDGAKPAKYPELEMTFGAYRTMWNTEAEYQETTVTDALREVKLVQENRPWLLCKTAEELAEWVRENVAPARRYDWEIKHRNSFNTARYRGWQDTIYRILTLSHTRPDWDESNAVRESLKYKTLKEFREGAPGAYQRLLRDGVLRTSCSHLAGRVMDGFWDETTVLQVAQKYRTRTEFKKLNNTAYKKATELGILAKACGHMGTRRNEKVPIKCHQNNVVYSSLSAASKTLGVHAGALHQHLKGKYKQVKGYTFRYLTDEEVAEYFSNNSQEGE